MDKFPLVWDGVPVGELKTEAESLYTAFSADSRPLSQGLWCAWAVGQHGELRLGILEPTGERMTLHRRFSQRMTAPLGRLLRGEIRSAEAKREEMDWKNAPHPETLVQDAWLQGRLRGAKGALCCRREEGVLLALPWEERKPFPLTALFCFAQVRSIQGRRYAVFAFDGQGRPAFLPT